MHENCLKGGHYHFLRQCNVNPQRQGVRPISLWWVGCYNWGEDAAATRGKEVTAVIGEATFTGSGEVTFIEDGEIISTRNRETSSTGKEYSSIFRGSMFPSLIRIFPYMPIPIYRIPFFPINALTLTVHILQG